MLIRQKNKQGCAPLGDLMPISQHASEVNPEKILSVSTHFKVNATTISTFWPCAGSEVARRRQQRMMSTTGGGDATFKYAKHGGTRGSQPKRVRQSGLAGEKIRHE